MIATETPELPQTPSARAASVKKTISLRTELAKGAESKAAAECRSFSGYVQSLIARDLSEGSSTLSEGEPEKAD